MKKSFLFNAAVFLLLAGIIVSCGNSQFRGYEKSDTGLYYKFHKKGDDTAKANIGDLVVVDMLYSLDDSVLFDSRKISRELEFPVEPSQFQGDLYEGLLMMGEGDSATFLISADSFYLITARAPKLPPFVDSGSYMTFEIGMKSLMSKEEKARRDQEMLDMRREQEQVDLNKYLEDNDISVEPTNSGLYYIPVKKGSGRKANKGEMVKIHMTVSLIDGMKIFSTKDRGEPIEYEFGRKFDTEGLEEAVGMMRKGGKANLIVPSKIAFGAQQRGQVIEPYSTLLYEVELVDIRNKAAYDKEQEAKRNQQQAEQNQMEGQEDVLLQKYLKENDITAKPLESGLIYIEQKKGTGPQAVPGVNVKVHYTGKLLDGTVFDSSVERGEPFGFVLGQGRVIKGWDEGIALMREGGKATLIIPSSLGYGSRGAGNRIPPFSTLVFDVELVSVE